MSGAELPELSGLARFPGGLLTIEVRDGYVVLTSKNAAGRPVHELTLTPRQALAVIRALRRAGAEARRRAPAVTHEGGS